MKTIYLAGGCFWGVQRFFDNINGVEETICGYANGKTENPTYEQVKSQQSGHSETVKITYNEKIISLEKLLTYYYKIIDPTSLNKQGEDEGISYRSGIYYINEDDQTIIKTITKKEQEKYENKIVVEILPLYQFYKAEEYHQKYLEKNPHGYCHIPIHLFEDNEK